MYSEPDLTSPLPHVDGYLIERCIGRGGCGVVYKAHRTATGQPVAIKLLRPEVAPSSLRRARARQEAQLLVRLRHPGIAQVVGAEALPDGGVAIVMEYLDGEPLRGRLRGEPLPLPAALRWVGEVAAALAYAHGQGVVHRDIKPENIMLVPGPQGEAARVLDFGIAKGGPLPASSGSATQPETAEGALLGTLPYMAPEQLRSARAVDGAADVFSLGVVLHEVLAGTLPGGAPPIASSAAADLAPALAPALGRSRAVPRWLADLLRAMLAPDPAARPAMAEVAAALAPLPGGRCPFPGLEPFDEEEARLYFGREDEVAAALALLGGAAPGRDPGVRYRRWLQIEGASGSGKSSLLRAGLLPALRHRGLSAGPRVLQTIYLRPGRRPLLNLAQALFQGWPGLGPTLGAILERLREPAALRDLLREITAPGDAVVLGLDQLEELFVMAEDAEAAQLDRLLAAALDDEGPLHLLTTVRSDFLGHMASLPSLERRLNEAARFHLLPMGEAGLREALLGPCARAGLRCEPGLAERVVADTAGLGGCLPLLGHTLRALYEARAGDLLTMASYDQLGGVGGALGRATDALVDGLGEQGRERARRLLLSLVRTGRGVEDARRARTLAETVAAAGGDAEAERVLQRLSGGRDPATPTGAAAPVRILVSDGERVELIHEALLRHMPALRRWIEEDRRLLERREDLEAAATTWRETGCPSDGLPQGVTLAYFTGADLPEGGAARLGALASPLAERYLAEAGRRAADMAAEESRRRRRRRRLGMLQTAAAIGFLAVAGYALHQRREAHRLADASQQLARDSLDYLDRMLSEVDGELEYISGTFEARAELLRQTDAALLPLSRSVGGWRGAKLLAMQHIRHGDFEKDYGRLRDAEQRYRAALRQVEAPGPDAPAEEVLRLRAESLSKLGKLAANAGDTTEALARYEELRRLLAARKDRKSLEWLAEAAWRSGQLRMDSGAYTEAQRDLTEAETLLGKESAMQERLAFVLYYQAIVALDQGDLPAAARACTAALARQRPLAQANAGYAVYWWHYGRLLLLQAAIDLRSGDGKHAAQVAGEALSHLRRLSDENGWHRRYKLAYAEGLRGAAAVARDGGSGALQLTRLREARSIGETLLDRDPDDGGAARELVLTYEALAEALPPAEQGDVPARAERLRRRLEQGWRFRGDRHLFPVRHAQAPAGP